MTAGSDAGNLVRRCAVPRLRHHFLRLGLGDVHGQQGCEQSLVDRS